MSFTEMVDRDETYREFPMRFMRTRLIPPFSHLIFQPCEFEQQIDDGQLFVKLQFPRIDSQVSSIQRR